MESASTAISEATAGTFAGWLAALPDDDLVELLGHRTDLTVPPPPSLSVLAARAESRLSLARAAEDLDTLALAVVEALGVLGAADRPVSRDELAQRLPGSKLESALRELGSRAIIWGGPGLLPGDTLRMVPLAAELVPWPLGWMTAPAELSPAQIATGLATVSPAERELLGKLVSQPVGRTRDAAPDSPADSPVQRLLEAKLLEWVDAETVRLPRPVSLVLRGQDASTNDLAPPAIAAQPHAVSEVNGVAAGEVLELLRQCTALLETLGEAPAPALRAGGLGIREIRRLAKQTGLQPDRAGLLMELLAGAGLLLSGQPEPAPDDEEYWAPSTTCEAWFAASPARQWEQLASAWLALPRVPWLIGMRDPADKPLAALSAELRNAVAPVDRRTVLDVLAAQDTGAGLTAGQVVTVLAWQRPRLAHRFTPRMVGHTLAEATALGLLGRDALSSPGRALLHGGDAAAEMLSALPEPVDYVLVQADLTVIAPGPLVPGLQAPLALAGDLESAGGAAVYRLSEASVRRALDAGLTAAELHALFARHSRTPVPQALTYLIDDVARRHGLLRAGVARAFVRCDDPALLAQVLAAPVAEDLALRGIAPGVAISQAPLAEVLEGLRAAGFAPAAEDSAGGIIDVRPHGTRIAARRIRPQLRLERPPSPEQLAMLVTDLRANDRAAKAGARQGSTRASGAAILALLQLALRTGRLVSIGVVDAHGVASHRIVAPTNISGGQLTAREHAGEAIRHFPLHRVASVALVED